VDATQVNLARDNCRPVWAHGLSGDKVCATPWMPSNPMPSDLHATAQGILLSALAIQATKDAGVASLVENPKA
jgi:hypothetical protein